jgi:hypothetical protein
MYTAYYKTITSSNEKYRVSMCLPLNQRAPHLVGMVGYWKDLQGGNHPPDRSDRIFRACHEFGIGWYTLW